MKKHIHFIFAILVAIVVSSCTGATWHPGPLSASKSDAVAQTKYGKVIGYTDDGVYCFKGIPYAKADRFCPPQEPDPWEGVRLARVYGPACPQPSSSLWSGQTDNDFAYKYTKEMFDEKNLFTVNVFTKGLRDGATRPVFVWFHGGGFTFGSGINLPCYEGTSLARKGDIVVVTVNHRLNTLGFMDLSAYGEKYKYSANNSVLDMVAALRWVRDNITEFGGDPSQVTIAGQSGGGMKVQLLLVTPSAKGLFSKAIIQSGPIGEENHLLSREASERRAAAILEELGISPDDVGIIETVPYEDLHRAAVRASARLGMGGMMGTGDAPVLDGQTLPYDYLAPEAAELFKDIPVLVGSTFNEFESLHYDKDYSDDEARAILAERYGDRADSYMGAFKAAYPGRGNSDMLSVNLSVRAGVNGFSDRKTALGGAPVYTYLFAWKSPALDYSYAACHNMDLPFMFNNIDKQRELTGSTPDAYRLAEKVSGAWIAFTKYGDPNAKGLPRWKPCSQTMHNVMIFDRKCEAACNHDTDLLSFYIQ